VGSRLTRPQALAATPLQLGETATIPIESGPGYIRRNERPNISIEFMQAMTMKVID